MKEELKAEAAGRKHILIIDESTDVSCQKHLAEAISYLAPTGVITYFFSLIPVTDTTAETLYTALNAKIMEYGLNMSDCIGIGVDGASVMVGNNNSVWTRVKEALPDCIQLRCICHSLALCIQTAFSELPLSLGFLLKSVPKWFAKSSLRRDAYRQIFATFNADSGLESGVNVSTPFQG